MILQNIEICSFVWFKKNVDKTEMDPLRINRADQIANERTERQGDVITCAAITTLHVM